MLDNNHALVGREKHLATARGLVSSGTAQLSYSGPPGVGKTALLRATVALAEESGVRAVWAQAHPLERDFAFGVVRQLFQPLLTAMPETQRTAVLADLAGAAAQVVWQEAGDDTDTFAVLHALYWLTARLAEQQPLLLAVDDLQWADTASLRWLLYMARRCDGIPVVLAASRNTAEPGTDPDLLAELADTITDVPVTGLDLGQVAELVADLFGRVAEPGFVAAAHQATDGNPFLLRELVTTMAAEGMAPTDAIAGRLARLAPRTVSDWVLARMRRSSPAAVELAKAVAVLGDGTDLSTAAALAGMPLEQAAESADALIAMRLLTGAHPLRFAHSIVRNAVSLVLDPAERRAAHGRTAGLLHDQNRPTEQIAAHLLAADPSDAPWAVDVLQAAARTAAHRGAPDAATTYLRRAMREPLDDVRRLEVLTELGNAELSVDLPAAVDHLTEAFDRATEPQLAADIAAKLSSGIAQRGDHAGAAQVLNRGLARLGPAHAELVTRLEGTSLMVGHSLFSEDRIGRARRLHDASVPLEIRRRAAAALAMHTALVGGSRAEAVALATESAELGPPRDLFCVAALGMVAGVFCFADRLDDARRTAEEMIGFTRLSGLPAAGQWGRYVLARIAFQDGRLTDTLEELQVAREIQESISGEDLHPDIFMELAESYVEQGGPDAALRMFAEHGLTEDGPTTPEAFAMLSTRGRLRLRDGDATGALADQLQYGQVLTAVGVRNPAASEWRSRAALAHHALGQREDAVRLAEEELALARDWGAPRPVGIALRALGVIRDDLDLLVESVEVLAEAPARLPYAYSLFRLGVALHERGQREEARTRLHQAYRLAAECGADALVESAGAAITRTGGRRPRAVRTGVDALTAQQRKIAELAAEGASNRQIAERLYLTLRTVEHHLTSAYRTLGVDGRDQLTAVLRTIP
ncbi:ATP-binding protein [Actinocrispum wychmicini]|uniref:Regulatory LuxR family protein n=1 Tax=Actinocrispum wychmicini TaxID=1213861 RepID=A0A4R2JGH3_9PSEU|nr:LuxR family transcriptional regulator [Actinocrispum wychmicini]TCO56026.1 regulatory LuxR family protein [Actinocrispum wychmicini]